jgi:hypothetical protein
VATEVGLRTPGVSPEMARPGDLVVGERILGYRSLQWLTKIAKISMKKTYRLKVWVRDM